MFLRTRLERCFYKKIINNKKQKKHTEDFLSVAIYSVIVDSCILKIILSTRPRAVDGSLFNNFSNNNTLSTTPQVIKGCQFICQTCLACL